MALTNYERETIIRRSADEKYWDIYSAIPRDITRLRRTAAAFGFAVQELPDDAIRVLIPVKALTFRAADTTGRIPKFAKQGA